LLKTKGNLQDDPINKPMNTRDTAGTGTVCSRCAKNQNRTRYPALPVLETPWVFPYPCGTLVRGGGGGGGGGGGTGKTLTGAGIANTKNSQNSETTIAT